MFKKSKLMNVVEIFTGILLFMSVCFGVAGAVMNAQIDHLSLLQALRINFVIGLWFILFLVIVYGLFLRIRWIIPLVVLISLYFSLFAMDSLYLYATGSYIGANCINKLSSLFMIIVAPFATISCLLWQLEYWKKNKSTFVSEQNLFAQYFVRLMPMLLMSGWLVLIAGIICSYWITYYLYVYSQQSVMYTGLILALAGYFIIWLGCSWAMIYKQRWLVLLFLIISIFALIPGMLSFHMVIWLALAWWEKLVLLFFGLTTLIAYFLSFAGEWLWVMERRRNRNLKKKKTSPLWAQIFVSLLFLLALIKILTLPFTEYRDMAGVRQSVEYYFTHA